MKILYHHRTQAEDGQAVHIRSLQRAFRELGAEVREVGLVAQGGEGGGGEQNLESQRARWRWVQAVPPSSRELLEYGYSIAARRRVAKAIAEFAPDLVYERYAFGNAGGVAAAARARVPLFLEVNSPMVLELGATRGLAFPRLARRIERSVFRRATRVVAVTEVLAGILRQEGVEAERLLVTPNGVELERYAEPGDRNARARARAALGLPEEDQANGTDVVLGFVGFYRDWHRLDVAVEALLQPGLERAHLVLIGEGPARADLEARASALGCADRVVFAGRHPHDRVPGLLPAFDVALLPAINAYASPLKLHEYMAAGLACVAPDQQNLREVLDHDHNAVLVPPGDADAFAQAVVELARDGGRRARLGTAARRTVIERDLTWIGNARRVLAEHARLGDGAAR